MLTQIARFGHMMKVSVNKTRVHVAMRNKQEGSVLKGTVKVSCLGIEARVELESDEPPERVAAMVRMPKMAVSPCRHCWNRCGSLTR